jgi:crossover junction endodeoxyribonuclease RuvC
MKVLGFDPGSLKLGYGVLEPSGSSWRRCQGGTLKLNGRDPLSRRLAVIYREVTGLLETHRPGLVAIEECFVAHSPKAALVLGEVRGVLLLAVEQAGIPMVELAPRSVKLAVVGHGAAAKEQIQYMIARLVADCPTPLAPDEADALAIALAGASHGALAGRMEAGR